MMPNVIKKYWIEISLVILCTYKAGIKGLGIILFIIVFGWTIGRCLQEG